MGEHNNEPSLVHRTPPTVALSLEKGPSQRPHGPPSGGVGAFEDGFLPVGQVRTHTSTRVGRRFVVPKLPTKGAPNAHRIAGLDGWTLQKKERKDQKLNHFWGTYQKTALQNYIFSRPLLSGVTGRYRVPPQVGPRWGCVPLQYWSPSV